MEAMAVMERVVRDPAVLVDVARKAQARLSAERHQRRVLEYADLVQPPAVGLARTLGVPVDAIEHLLRAEGYHRVLADLEAYEAPMRARRMGGPGFLEACYTIVRALRPEAVLETGVAHGYSSAVILQALEDNGRGRLYSVDLPRFRPGIVPFTGGAVPQRLRSRWELHLGSDRRMLPGLLRRTGPVGFLFYDSDTAYQAMLHTWELVWPRLEPGAVMAMNVVHANDACLEFAEAHGVRPVIIPQPKRAGVYQRERARGERTYYMGLLRKPPAG